MTNIFAVIIKAVMFKSLVETLLSLKLLVFTLLPTQYKC